MAVDPPLVTVVTPVLDRVESLDRCLDSVASQTYPAIEHIVIDGGSTDGTLEILERRAAEGTLSYVSEPDDGMYDAINKGLDRASGDVLAYINSDDLLFPWTVEVAVETLGFGADLSYGDLVRIDIRTPAPPALALQFYPSFALRYYTHHLTLAQPTVIWRREVTEAIGGFDRSYRLLGDCEYWLRAATAGFSFAHTGEFQAVQFDHEGTLRVTQEATLREEFRRLRGHYRTVAGEPLSDRHAAVKRSFGWRANQLRLRREIARSEPQRWRRFIAFLREHDVDVDLRGLVLYQLPERWRPEGLAWLEPEAFDAALHAVAARP